MKFWNNIKTLKFRLDIRKTLQQGTKEYLDIVNEEIKREYERRRKIEGKKR